MTTVEMIFYIGAGDAIAIAALGVVAAFLVLTGQDVKMFWDRIVPACAVLVGTSFAAGCVMTLTRWLTGS